jgi:hypothetical protein
MIEIPAPKNYVYRHIETKQIVGKTFRFCDWKQTLRFELVKSA